MSMTKGKLLAAFGRADAKDFADFDNIFATEFYLAHMLHRVIGIKNFPKTTKPFDKKELIDFFLTLSDKLFKKIKPT